MARNTAGNDDVTEDDIEDGIEEPADATALDAFDDDFDTAAAAAIDDDADAGAGGAADDDVVEGDATLLDDEGDEGDEAAGATKGVDRGDGRDTAGKFATKAEQDAAAAKSAAKAGDTPVETQGDKPADAAADAPAAAKDAEPTWEPLSVRVDKTAMPIEEVKVTRRGGFHLLAVKDADFPRFAQRMSKGVVGEKLWRDLQSGLKDLQAERAAPQPKSDQQIEAEIVLATIKDRLGELLEPHELENLEMRVKLAQRDYKDTYAAERKTFFDKRAEDERAAEAPEVEERAQYEGIAKEMLTVFERHKPAIGDLTQPQLKAAYDELAAIRRAVFWKEPDGNWYTNTELIFKALKAAAAHGAPAGPEAPAAGAAASGTASGTSAPPAKPGHTADASSTPTAPASAASTAADRFNRAGETAARPGTTSLKANRGSARPRPARHTRDATDGQSTRPVKTAAMLAEDKARAQQRKFLSSDSLDFEDEDDDS